MAYQISQALQSLEKDVGKIKIVVVVVASVGVVVASVDVVVVYG